MLKLFITDLCAYNNGFFVGEWVSFPLSCKELYMAINCILCEGEHLCHSDVTHEVI